MALVTDIKNKIKTFLDELVTAGTLGEVQMDDFKISPVWERDFAKYPAAILTMPAIEGGYFTNRQNERVHTFEIVIVSKGENIASATDIETLAEAILDKFDNQPTLAGKADGGVEPSTTPAEPITSRGKSLIIFSVIIKAKAIKDLSF